jgi:hypothetical protein
MKEIRTEIVINTGVERVWKTLTFFKQYPEWNPFISMVQGDVRVGKTIKIRLTPPGMKPMIFKSRVIKIDPDRELRWIGHLILPGIFDGEHIFELAINSDWSTTLVQREIFGGVLIPFLKNKLEDNIRRGFEMMNKRLKEECELSSPAAP